MRKIILASSLALGALALTSCSYTMPFAGASGKVGAKQAEASYTSFLYAIPAGDAGIATAARKAGITQVGTVDVKVFTFLGLWTTFTTIITGD